MPPSCGFRVGCQRKPQIDANVISALGRLIGAPQRVPAGRARRRPGSLARCTMRRLLCVALMVLLAVQRVPYAAAVQVAWSDDGAACRAAIANCAVCSAQRQHHHHHQQHCLRCQAGWRLLAGRCEPCATAAYGADDDVHDCELVAAVAGPDRTPGSTGSTGATGVVAALRPPAAAAAAAVPVTAATTATAAAAAATLLVAAAALLVVACCRRRRRGRRAAAGPPDAAGAAGDIEMSAVASSDPRGPGADRIYDNVPSRVGPRGGPRDGGAAATRSIDYARLDAAGSADLDALSTMATEDPSFSTVLNPYYAAQTGSSAETADVPVHELERRREVLEQLDEQQVPGESERIYEAVAAVFVVNGAYDDRHAALAQPQQAVRRRRRRLPAVPDAPDPARWGHRAVPRGTVRRTGFRCCSAVPAARRRAVGGAACAPSVEVPHSTRPTPTVGFGIPAARPVAGRSGTQRSPGIHQGSPPARRPGGPFAAPA